MKRITIYFEENGNEYTGCLVIDCDLFFQISDRSISVNNGTITIDEKITSIEIEEK